jgi:hypothetical protein
MSEIEKYKKYLRFKANPRYLRRDFIVPLYTGTEPDIVPETSVEQQGAVQEFNDGGRVGFELGGRIARRFKDIPKKHSFIKRGKSQTDFEGIIKEIDNIILRSNADPFSSLTPGQVIQEIGYRDFSAIRNKKLKDKFISMKKNLIPLDQKFKNYALNLLNNLDTLSFDEIVKSKGFANFFEEKFNTRMIGTKLKKVYNSPEFKDLREIIKTLSRGSILNAYNNKGKTVEEVLSNLNFRKSSGIPYIKSIPGKILNVAERSVNQGNKDIRLITRGENKELLDPKNIMFEWNKKLYGINPDIETYKGRKVNNLTTDLYKLPEFDEYLNSLNKLEETKNKIVQHPVTQKSVTLNKLLQETYSTGKEGKNSYGKSALELDHVDIKNEPFSNLRVLPRHINQTAGLIGKDISIIENKNKALKAIGYNIPEEALENSILKFSDRVLNKGIPINQTYEVALRDLTGASKEYLSPESKITTEGLQEERTGTEKLFKEETQVRTSSGLRPVSEKETKIPKEFSEQKKTTVEYLTNYLNENPDEVKAFRTAGIVCRRSPGGKVDVECLAENVIKEVEKLETGTDLQKTSALNKFKNATKLGTGLAEEIIGFGKGVVGRTLGPLAALNSALEQWTAGNTAEGFRKIGDLVDLTTLVGDPFGFEKSRREGTEADIKKIIGEKNYKGFENIKSAANEYNQYLETKKKFERAKSAAEGAYDPLSPGVDTTYLTDLEKQKNILEKNITGTKYGDVEDNLLNYANILYEDILKRNPNAAESSKYSFKTAVFEQLERLYGPEFINLFKDDLNKKFGPDLNIIDIQQQKLKPLSEEQQNVIESGAIGAAEGGRIGFDKGGISKRGFLKLLGGTAATGAIAPDLIKAFKGGKTATQIASKIKFEKAQGMYPWFPDLVEKIKVQGKPYEEPYYLKGEASYKHEAKGYGGLSKGEEKLTHHIDGDTEFVLREYPDGRIAVDIHSPRNQEGIDFPITLYYRPTMELKYYNGIKVEPAEFKVLEKEPRYFAQGPDDVDITMSETRKIPGRDTIYGDVEAAERFATGDIKNRKIIPAKQARRDQMTDQPADFIEETTNYGPVYD